MAGLIYGRGFGKRGDCYDDQKGGGGGVPIDDDDDDDGDVLRLSLRKEERKRLL